MNDFAPDDDGGWVREEGPGVGPDVPVNDNASSGFILELEMQLLGSMMAGGDHGRVFALLKPHNFVEPIHGEIYALIVAAKDSYSSTTLPTVAKLIPPQLAESFKAAAGVTLVAYLAECLASAVYGAGGSYAGARNVLEQWARVSLGKEAATIAEAARDPQAKSLDLARTASASFDDITADLRSAGRGKTLNSFAVASDNAMAAARDASGRGRLVGIPTGLADVDRATGGLHRKDLTTMAARPSMGKTTAGTGFARRAASHGFGVGFISLEMDATKLAARIISDIGHDMGVRVPYSDLINGTATLDQIDALEAAQKNYEAMPLWIEDQSGLNVGEVRVKTEKMMERAEKTGTPMAMLIVDHLHLIKASSRYTGQRVQEVTEITGELKAIARDYDLAVVLLAQLNRALEQRDNKRPQLSDLRDSGSIEQDSDTVMFLYRRAVYLDNAKPKDPEAIVQWDEECRAAANDLELSIAKQRNGPKRIIDLYVDVSCSAVRNKAAYGEAAF